MFSAIFKILGLKSKPVQLIKTMNEAVIVRKARYDGRSKKRQWEERRTDKGAAFDVKKSKQEGTEDDKPFERIKRRKFALLLGYSGQNYFGMQRNPKTKTIEEELFNAFLSAELITQEAFEQVQTIQYQRAARTDKGVSAARQVISIKLPEAADITKANDLLPDIIRIFGIKRVTKGFNSKSQCDGRTYVYMLPTVSFSRKGEEVDQETYRLSDDTFSNINEILKLYIGTKNYHNFTSKKKSNDPSAKRYIMEFNCEKPFVRKNVEFTILKVKGQSFMMHQIRKMVGLLISIIKGYTTKETLSKAFTEERVNVPRAPGLGLLLDFVHYDRYNFRYGKDGMHDTLEWKEQDAEVEAFKEKYIYPNIVNTEIEEKPMLEWVEKLSLHSYDMFEGEEEDEKNGNDEASSDEDENNQKNNKT